MASYVFGDSANLCGEGSAISDEESAREESLVPPRAPEEVADGDGDDAEVTVVAWGGGEASSLRSAEARELTADDGPMDGSANGARPSYAQSLAEHGSGLVHSPSARDLVGTLVGGMTRTVTAVGSHGPKFLTKVNSSQRMDGDDDADDSDDDDIGEEFRGNIFPRRLAPPYIMNPLEDWRLTWDLFTIILIVFVMLVTPFELAFISTVSFRHKFERVTPVIVANKHTGLWFANQTVNLGFVIDIVFNFLTAVFDEKQHRWIMSHGEIASLYLRSWFILDVGTIVPFDEFAGSETSLIRLLRLLRLFKLVKVLKSEKVVSRVSRHMDVSTKLQTIAKYCVMMLVLIHWSACALRIVTDYNLKECRMSAGQDSRCPTTVLTTTGNWGEGVWIVYVEACIWALIALNGEADAHTHAECVLGILIMLIGVIILAFLIGDMSNIMSNLDPVKNEFKQTLDNLNDYMRKKTGFPDALRLRLREYILLSEPVFRDHFNKEMLSKLSPSLQLIVAKQNLGRTVTRMPFTAYTIHSVRGFKRGSRVRVRQQNDDPGGAPATYEAAVVVRSPALLRYDVEYAAGRVERDVKSDRLSPAKEDDGGARGDAARLQHQVDAFVASVARLLVAQLYMPFDTVIRGGIDLNTVMYVVDSGKVICLNYDKLKTFGISLKEEKDFFGVDIAMVASAKPVLRDYSATTTRITQLHALDVFEFLDLLDSNPGLAVFQEHFKRWGCWVRVKRAFLDIGGRNLVARIRDARARRHGRSPRPRRRGPAPWPPRRARRDGRRPRAAPLPRLRAPREARLLGHALPYCSKHCNRMFTKDKPEGWSRRGTDDSRRAASSPPERPSPPPSAKHMCGSEGVTCGGGRTTRSSACPRRGRRSCSRRRRRWTRPSTRRC